MKLFRRFCFNLFTDRSVMSIRVSTGKSPQRVVVACPTATTTNRFPAAATSLMAAAAATAMHSDVNFIISGLKHDI